METTSRAVNAEEVFADISAQIDSAETWRELQEILNSMDIVCTAAIIDCNMLMDILREDCSGAGYETLDEWRTLAELILAIPQGSAFYLWNGWLNFKALTDDDFAEVKELCRREAKSFAEWLCEDGKAFAKNTDK